MKILNKEDNVKKIVAIGGGHGLSMLDLFAFRFDEGELDGHSLGNLILVALTRQLGSFEKAVEKASELLNVRGKVLPASISEVILCANSKSGLIRGQVNVENTPDINNDPKDVLPLDGVVDAILDANHIIYAPGSLYSSVLPSLLIKDIQIALNKTIAKILMIMNLGTKGPDTEGMDGDDHLDALINHGVRVDSVLCDKTRFSYQKIAKVLKLQLKIFV